MFARKALLALAVSSILLGTNVSAETFSTNFEFENTSGEFTLNEGANAVTFSGAGGSTFVGDGSLYRSGRRAFLFEQGTATISFETAPQSITLFLRNRPSSSVEVISTVNVFEIGNDLPIATLSGNSARFEELTYTSAIGIDRIEAINNTADYAAIDDFSFTSFTPPIIDSIPVEDDPEKLTDPIPESIPVSDITLDLELVTDALTDPVVAISAPDLSGFTFIAEQSGNIWSLNEENDALTNILSLGDSVLPVAFLGDERGLLGFAFHPDFSSNGLVYLYTSEPVTDQVDFNTLADDEAADHHSVITEWQTTTNETTGISFDTNSRRELFRVAQPQANHNAGSLVFDNVNNLIISFGDGGMADDQGIGHSFGGNGQDNSNILGTIARIDPLTRNSSNGNYGIPADNPFINDDTVLNEIYATGLRNPFRAFYDLDTDLLYVGDVGQNDIEEINLIEPGNNYGWPEREGSFAFFSNGSDSGFVFDQQPNADFTDPIAQYDHDTGIAVIGGRVYKGNANDELTGQYIFGNISGEVFYLDEDNAINQIQIGNNDFTDQAILSFGQDSNEQLYILTKDIDADTGSVFRVRNQTQTTENEDVIDVEEDNESSSSSSGGSLGSMLILMVTGLVARVRRSKKIK